MSTQAGAVNGVSVLGMAEQLATMQAQLQAILGKPAPQQVSQPQQVSSTDPTGFGAKMKQARERKRVQSAAQMAAQAAADGQDMGHVSTDYDPGKGVSTDVPTVGVPRLMPVTPNAPVFNAIPAVGAVATPRKRKRAQAVAVGAGLASIPQVMAESGVKPVYEPRVSVYPIARLANGKLVTMGVSGDPQYAGNIGFRVGDGKVKWGKAQTWEAYALCSQGILAYLAKLK